jgi:hypothetical protein
MRIPGALSSRAVEYNLAVHSWFYPSDSVSEIDLIYAGHRMKEHSRRLSVLLIRDTCRLAAPGEEAEKTPGDPHVKK